MNEKLTPKRPFLDTLRDLEGGQLLEDLTDMEREVLEAIDRHGDKGSITIKIMYTQKGPQMAVEAKIASSYPQPRGATVFFADGADLFRENPRQRKLDIGPRVDTTTGEIITNGHGGERP